MEFPELNGLLGRQVLTQKLPSPDHEAALASELFAAAGRDVAGLSRRLPPEIEAMRRTDPIVNAVMCLGERDGLSDVEMLSRMVVELAKCNNARLEELVRISRERAPAFSAKST